MYLGEVFTGYACCSATLYRVLLAFQADPVLGGPSRFDLRALLCSAATLQCLGEGQSRARFLVARSTFVTDVLSVFAVLRHINFIKFCRQNACCLGDRLRSACLLRQRRCVSGADVQRSAAPDFAGVTPPLHSHSSVMIFVLSLVRSNKWYAGFKVFYNLGVYVPFSISLFAGV